MKNIYKTAGYAFFLSSFIWTSAVQAETAEPDLSCMKEMVRPIIQVTDRHQEFDVVIRNQCPGAVYWAMCIDRMNPWTHKVLENHTPTGYVEAEKKSRVNMQMKATPNASGDENRAQAFYVNVSYSIEKPTSAACVASQCEAKKTGLRAAVEENRRAWRKAWQAVEAKAVADCPDNGWNSADLESCRQGVFDAAAEDLSVYSEADESLAQQLAAIDPETCTVYGGNVLVLKKNPKQGP